MINATELRLGNTVLHAGRQCSIEHIMQSQCNTKLYPKMYPHLDRVCLYPWERWVDVKEIEPIPITEEWLERLGFEKMLDSADADYGVIEWTKSYEVSYQSGPEYITLWPNKGGSNGDFLLDCYSAAPLKYIHQLQNCFFALTGQELTIKETV